MSLVYVAEFPGLAGTDQGDSVNILAVPASVEYTVAVSGGVSGAAQPIQTSTKFLEISCDTTCSFAIGPSPGVIGTGTAALTNCRLNANERVIRRVPQSYAGGGSQAPKTYSVFTTANV